MRGELRIDGVRRRQQAAGAGEIGEIAVRLAGIDRVVGQAVDLGALDLAIPVGALDQADHQAPPAAPGEVDERIDQRRAALLVSLDDEAEAVPAGQFGVAGEGFEQIEREFEAIGLLGVDVDADVVALGQQQQRLQAGEQFAADALALAALVTRMQRRQLDRDAGPGDRTATAAGAADGVDGLGVGIGVAAGVGLGQRGFAEHVEGVAVTTRLVGRRSLQRRLDLLAHDELLAEQAHREVDALADQRLAAAGNQPPERAGERVLAVRGDQLAGQQQAPGRGIDEQRGAAAKMRRPVAAADFVANQAVDRQCIGNPQQRLGQAHQGDAFLARQREFVH